ncbi:MAG: hypothetical protein FJ216_07665 [Ignavibacteria bacterium]|nr:hypothetical protein [Ignavibacteria bacterium]
MDKKHYRIIKSYKEKFEGKNYNMKPEKNLEILEILRQQFIELFNANKTIDKSFYRIIRNKSDWN